MKKVFFYDTCSLLNELHSAFENDLFYISSVTLEELENIKTSSSKDQDIKYRARQLLHLLFENKDKYKVVIFQKEWETSISNYSYLSDNNDSKIIFSAFITDTETSFDLVFKTDDLCCAALAKQIGLTVETTYEQMKLDNYTGFIEKIISNEELVPFYSKSNLETENHFNLLENQYLIVKDENGKIADSFKWKNGNYEQVLFPVLKTDMFGTIKPTDEYQKLAIDSLLSNKITVLRGPAGSGKSYLSFAALFQKLEKHEIDKIIIFCNTVATANSAKLGFYPGSRNEKLLDSQIGNFLSSKLGDSVAVERFIAEGKLALLPMSDIRGYDTTGMKAGIYITEAQNLDIELMRLALQRVGEDSICILDGDDQAQVDLSIYGGTNNGLRRVSEIFRGADFYGEVTLQKIHRSRIAELAQLM